MSDAYMISDKSAESCVVCMKKLHAGEQHLEVFYGGTKYCVCCASCAQKFRENPRQYQSIDFQE